MRLLCICPLDLRLYQAFEWVVHVPARAESFTLAQLYYDLIRRGPAQSQDIDPSDSSEELSDLSIRLFIALLICLTSQWAPEGAIGPSQVFLNGASSDGQNGRICISTQLSIRQHRI